MKKGVDLDRKIRIRTCHVSPTLLLSKDVIFPEFLSRMEGAAGAAAGQRVSPEQESCEDKFDPY
jgi:hypothetical protein